MSSENNEKITEKKDKVKAKGNKQPKKTLTEWTEPKEHLFNRFLATILTLGTGVVSFILLYVFNKTKIYGKEIINRENGPYIFASNHTTMFDSGFIDGVIFFRRGLKSYYNLPFHTPEYGNFYKNAILSFYMNHVKCIPLMRGKGLNQPAQLLVEDKLRNDRIVHIFPEGTRSRTGKLLPGKGGVGKRIYNTRVKVIPCYHEGIRDMLMVGTSMPKFGKKIRIIVGEPIYFDEFFDMEDKPATWTAISQKIMDEIAKLKDDLHKKEDNSNNKKIDN